MAMKLRVVAAALLLLGSVGGGLALTSFGDEATSTSIREAITVCDPDLSRENPIVSKQEQSCMVEVMYEFYRRGFNNELWEALRLQSQDVPDFYFACHDVLHKVGERALDEFKDMADLILQNNSDVCGTAFVMGGVDAFGAQKPTAAEFLRVAQACEAMSGPGFASRLRGMCEHSLGHAAGKSTTVVEQAADRCGLLATPSGQINCGDGVIMQIYQPANGVASRPLEDARFEMEELCESWPNIGSTRHGCYAGAGYIYSRPLFSYDSVVRGATAGTEALTVEQREKLKELSFDVVRLCKTHTWEEGVDACLERASQDIPASIYWDKDLTDELCAQFGRHQDRCIVYDEGF
jgi:hypothetical protein